jgi:hypothetical protein
MKLTWAKVRMAPRHQDPSGVDFDVRIQATPTPPADTKNLDALNRIRARQPQHSNDATSSAASQPNRAARRESSLPSNQMPFGGSSMQTGARHA